MKTLNFLKVLALSLTFTFISCDEDDNTDQNPTEKSCETLDFTSKEVEDDNAGSVQLQFEASEINEPNATLRYSWKAKFGENEFTIGGSNEGSDRIVNYEFEANGSYEVTVSIETPECPSGVEKTRTVEITGIESPQTLTVQ